MASNARRARRSNQPNKFVMATENNMDAAVQQLNDALANIDQLSQGIEDKVLTTRLTQVVVLGGTALEILSGLNMAQKAQAAAAAASDDSDSDSAE